MPEMLGGKKQNDLKKMLQVDASFQASCSLKAMLRKRGCTMSVFWLYKHNHLDPRNVSKAQAQVHVHTPAVAQPWPKTR